MVTKMMISAEEIMLAREFVNGDLDEETFRARLTDHAQAAIIEVLRLDLATTRRERDEAIEEAKAMSGTITMQERRIHELEARAEA